MMDTCVPNDLDDRDAQIIAEPLDPTELEEAISADRDDRSDEEWDLIELAAEKWLSGENRRLSLECPTGDVQAEAERLPVMRDNFTDAEIAAAFADQKTLDRVLDALDIANTDQDPAELIVQMIEHIGDLRSAKATSRTE